LGRLIDGKWVNQDLGPDAQGRYVRRAAQYRARVEAEPDAKFPAEKGRYHLYLSWACGWSQRTLILHALKGLDEIVGVSFTDAFMGEEGWTLSPGADPVLGAKRLYEIYLKTDPGYTGRASVPVLWDKKKGAIVTNESKDIAASFDSAFDHLGARPGTFLPEDQAEEITAMIEANYQAVNNGVYRAGFAGTQDAHAEAVSALFARLDELEGHLAEHRFLVGDTFSMADICLFPTLYRFDPVYNIHFKCNLKRLQDYPNLWAYTRAIYQMPGVAETCNLEQTKEHYYRSHESISPRRLIPLGPHIDYDAPHDR
jgi:putative glutathione S-transferase